MGPGPPGRVTCAPHHGARIPLSLPTRRRGQGADGTGFLGYNGHSALDRLPTAGPTPLPALGGQARPGGQGGAAGLPPNWLTTMLWSDNDCPMRPFSKAFADLLMAELRKNQTPEAEDAGPRVSTGLRPTGGSRRASQLGPQAEEERKKENP